MAVLGKARVRIGCMAKKLRVEFRYFDRSTCSRCKTTDENVAKTITSLRQALMESGVEVDFKTTKLPASRLAESNSILINGRDIEELVGGSTKRSTSCHGCGTLLDGPCDCRAYSYRGKKYRHIPKATIREAIHKAAK